MTISFLRVVIIAYFFFGLFHATFGQQVFQLYPTAIPNSKFVPDQEASIVNSDGLLLIAKISRPTITLYKPQKSYASGAAVIICPGGGYWVEAAGNEGADVALAFNAMGVTAFVLKYRIPSEETMINKEIGPLQDGQRAIQFVREHANQWRINPDKIGIMGFSAGGHLASTVGTHFSKNYIENPKGINLRPSFMILVYPVISFTDTIGHRGSRDQLIGKHPSQEKIIEYSNEYQVTGKTPPTFLVHAKDDPIKVENSIWFADSLKAHNVSFRLYLYDKGGHGYGMFNKSSEVRWMDLVNKWLKDLNFL